MTRPKEQLGNLVRELGDIITVSAAAKALDKSNIEVSKTLARWVKQGWLTRVRRGIYVLVPIEAEETNQMIEDIGALIPDMFAPCYIGGWSAAEYWGLTEQIFRDICIYTERPVNNNKIEIYNVPFTITHISNKLNFGTKVIWKKNKKVQISDPHKTIIDMLCNPKMGGGIQFIIDCLKEYIKSSYCNLDLIIEYAERTGNGALFKRFGYLLSDILGKDHPTTVLCKKHLTKGIAYLDPSVKNGRLVTSWRLSVPTLLQIKDDL